MSFEIFEIADAMVRETLLPNVTTLQAKRESPLDELNGTFEGNFFRGCEQKMNVVGHDHEFVQQIFPFVSVTRKRVNQEIGGCIAAKNWKSSGRDRSDKERAVEVHWAMVVRVEVGRL